MPSRVTKALKIVKGALDSLASRYLFDNWSSLLIRYALFRLGFDVRLVARVGDCTFELRPEVFACLVGKASYGLVEISCVDGELYINGKSMVSITVRGCMISPAIAMLGIT